MKIARIDFPDELITALNDGKLVVFAGAGESAGERVHEARSHRT